MRAFSDAPARRLAGFFALASMAVLSSGCGQSVSQQPISTSSLPDRPVVPTQPVYAAGYPASYTNSGYRWNGNTERMTTGAPPYVAAPANPPVVWHASPRPPAQQPASYLGSNNPPGQQRASNIIEVQPGDTLYGISRRHRVSVAALIDANRLPSINIQPGQTLMLPTRAR